MELISILVIVLFYIGFYIVGKTVENTKDYNQEIKQAKEILKMKNYEDIEEL